MQWAQVSRSVVALSCENTFQCVRASMYTSETIDSLNKVTINRHDLILRWGTLQSLILQTNIWSKSPGPRLRSGGEFRIRSHRLKTLFLGDAKSLLTTYMISHTFVSIELEPTIIVALEKKKKKNSPDAFFHTQLRASSSIQGKCRPFYKIGTPRRAVLSKHNRPNVSHRQVKSTIKTRPSMNDGLRNTSVPIRWVQDIRCFSKLVSLLHLRLPIFSTIRSRISPIMHYISQWQMDGQSRHLNSEHRSRRSVLTAPRST